MKHLVFKLAFLTLVPLSFNASAEIVTQTKVTTVNGVGEGLSREEAVDNALLEALGQINGVKIRRESISSVASIKSTDQSKSEFAYSSQIDKITKGKVDSYSILEVLDDGNGRYQATVQVTKTKVTKDYKVPGLPNNRRTLAVIPFDAELENFNVPKMNYPVSLVTKDFTQELVSSVTKTRKFAVLDRESFKAYNFEKRLLNFANPSSSDELLRFGKVLGADYLLVGNFAEFKAQPVSQHMQITGQTKNSFDVSATLQYRVLATATMQVKWSSTIRMQQSYANETDFNSAAHEFYQALSAQLTSEIIENIYPIKIADISSSGQVVLSQSVEQGRVYDVFALGKKLYDPYTKEYLGQEENLIGSIQVVRQLPKVSYADILDGKAKKGMIVRPQPMSDMPSGDYHEVGNSGTVDTRDGTVRLPFD